jgi:hypothetical protein
LASNGDGRENAIVELPECREYLELQRRVFANAYFSKQKVKKSLASYILFIACALLQEQSSQDGSRLNDISTEDGQLLLKSKKKKRGVCVCEKIKGAATAHWVEKDIT